MLITGFRFARPKRAATRAISAGPTSWTTFVVATLIERSSAFTSVTSVWYVPSSLCGAHCPRSVGNETGSSDTVLAAVSPRPEASAAA